MSLLIIYLPLRIIIVIVIRLLFNEKSATGGIFRQHATIECVAKAYDIAMWNEHPK